MKKQGLGHIYKDKLIDKTMENNLRMKIAHETMENVYIKYSIMRVRLKISYHAYVKDLTLNELWLK